MLPVRVIQLFTLTAIFSNILVMKVCRNEAMWHYLGLATVEVCGGGGGGIIVS